MAVLQLSNRKRFSDLAAIADILAPLKVHLKHYELGSSPLSTNLLELDVLDAHQKKQLLEIHRKDLMLPERAGDYSWCDLFTVHPGSPNLQTLSFNYSRYHVHTAAEAFCVLAGEAIVGLVQSDQQQLQLLVQPGDFLHIATGVEHWFGLSAALHLKAVRYFTTADGWMPYYTGTEINASLREPL